jgi:hypothetical protein
MMEELHALADGHVWVDDAAQTHVHEVDIVLDLTLDAQNRFEENEGQRLDEPCERIELLLIGPRAVVPQTTGRDQALESAKRRFVALPERDFGLC